MSKVLVQTGFGYYKDQAGNIIAKAELPADQHDLTDGLIYVEVADQAALEAIEVYQDPADILLGEQEQKIQQKLRQVAITELTKDGNWP